MGMNKLPPGIEKRGKSSYRLVVCHGYVAGKQQRYIKTVELPFSMTERAQIKEAERLRALFIAEVERGEVSNAKQMLTFV